MPNEKPKINYAIIKDFQPTETSKMFHLEPYGDEYDSIGILIHNLKSYEEK